MNAVGVNINTASTSLLSYVSGIGPKLAENIVTYRDENGAFASRNDIKNVPRLGGKAFEQGAGFFRIKSAKNPLDDSSVHPESYNIVEKIAKDIGKNVSDLIQSILNQFNKIDILVNNAGITKDALIIKMSENAWDEVINTNTNLNQCSIFFVIENGNEKNEIGISFANESTGNRTQCRKIIYLNGKKLKKDSTEVQKGQSDFLSILDETINGQKIIKSFLAESFFIKKFNSIFDIIPEKLKIPKLVQDLANKRNKARQNHEWDLSDELREEINSQGWIVEDTKAGQKCKPI